jgi:hypothetical protein
VVTGIGHTPTVLATGMVNAPLADGVYTLNASDVLGRAIKQGEDGNGPIWATEWAFGGSMMNLTLVVGNGCLDLAGCADIDNDGIRDDPCVWWSCDGVCNPVDIPFADMGGQFGSCLPDGTADGNDKFHALNCFSNQNTAGTPSYPCESTPPAALNVDAGGPFGDCSPDGVCDGNDAFHALNAFQGTSLCSCTSGPAPDVEPRVVGKAALVLEARQSTVKPGGIVEVDVHLAGPLPDLRGYQLHLGASGDAGAALVDIAVEERDDWIFAGRGAWRAFNIATGQMVAGLDSPGVIASAGGYLATFTYRVSEAASGAVSIGPLLTSESQQGRTFLFSTQTNGKIEISATSASVSVAPAAGSARRTGR